VGDCAVQSGGVLLPQVRLAALAVGLLASIGLILARPGLMAVIRPPLLVPPRHLIQAKGKNDT